MTKNSAAKRAIRDVQARTGAPYMEARRRTEDDRQWVVQCEAHPSNFRQPYPLVVDTAGHTFGAVDRGVLVGLVNGPDSHTFTTTWHDLVRSGDVGQAVGQHLVSLDRFTGGWATDVTPVASVDEAGPREARTTLYGGTRPDPDSERRLARRNLWQRPEAPGSFRFTAGDPAGHPTALVQYEVGVDHYVRYLDSGTALGVFEGFEGREEAGALLELMPWMGEGLPVVVWRNEFERVPLGVALDVTGF
jgi:hypothetical protein